MGHRVYIGIGSNQGAKLGNCERALSMLSAIPETRLSVTSSFFDSEPWGSAKEWYINAVAAIDTNLEPRALLNRCQAIEWDMGRRHTAQRWEDRIIDLDLLFFDDLVLDDPLLEIPHPELHKRKFVLVPMCEIAPDLVHPVLRVTVAQLLALVEDNKLVAPTRANE